MWEKEKEALFYVFNAIHDGLHFDMCQLYQGYEKLIFKMWNNNEGSICKNYVIVCKKYKKKCYYLLISEEDVEWLNIPIINYKTKYFSEKKLSSDFIFRKKLSEPVLFAPNHLQFVEMLHNKFVKQI